MKGYQYTIAPEALATGTLVEWLENKLKKESGSPDYAILYQGDRILATAIREPEDDELTLEAPFPLDRLTVQFVHENYLHDVKFQRFGDDYEYPDDEDD